MAIIFPPAWLSGFSLLGMTGTEGKNGRRRPRSAVLKGTFLKLQVPAEPIAHRHKQAKRGSRKVKCLIDRSSSLA